MVGSIPGLQQAVGLYVNVAPSTVISGVEQGSTDHDYESQSQLVAIDLEVGYSVYASCGPQYAPSQLYGSRDYQTILSGFLYEPAQVVCHCLCFTVMVVRHYRFTNITLNVLVESICETTK